MAEPPWRLPMDDKRPAAGDRQKLEGRTLELFEESFERNEEALRRLAER